ncbi:hypothetical protein CTI12_AA205300 [Artemisia annua]|uniref:DUF674 family protein n=1 Tax=Artemisia annua TaxID=35608 RepID=A0A2U1P166_ARTAN|nr:hypothetical protein CTI12_AA205300 [Artemisia annua]
MGNYPSTVDMKVFIDKRNNKVMFAEANEDFVEILFSFFTLPLGTIARLSRNSDHPNPRIKVGSLSSLYDSAMWNIRFTHFSDELCRDVLANPVNSSAALCEKLRLNLNDNSASVNSRDQREAVFVKKKGSFIITDDLCITPFLLDRYIELRNSFGVEDNDLLVRYFLFDLNQFVNLLKWSLLTNNPLTTLVNGGSKPSPCSSCIEDATLDNLSSLFSNSAQPHSRVKFLIHKSKKKVLCAEVDNSFVEMLLSFLTIPLAAVKVLTKDTSSPVAINNLYKSISALGDENYLKSDDIKNMLLSPKLASIYFHATDLLPIYEKGITQGSFLKEQATFIVSDDLKIELSSFYPTLWIHTRDIPADDIKIVEMSIGEPHALMILKASLTSTSALTDCLNAFWKNSKAKST